MSKELILAKIQEEKAKRKPKPKERIVGSRSPISTELKRKLGLKDGDIVKRAPKVVEEIKRKLLPSRHTRGRASVSATKIDQALAEHLAGESQVFTEKKYGLPYGALKQEMRRRFVTTEEREQFLEDILLNNSILSSLEFEKKAPELSARDAAMAAGIFTQRFSEFKQARKTDHQPEVPVAVVIQLNETLAKIRERHPNLALEDQDAIDIDTEKLP